MFFIISSWIQKLILSLIDTKSSSFGATVDTLNNAGVKIAGVIMNKVKKPRFGYGYGYGYGYYYNYYYYNYKYSEDQINPSSNGNILSKIKGIIGNNN